MWLETRLMMLVTFSIQTTTLPDYTINFLFDWLDHLGLGFCFVFVHARQGSGFG